MENLIVHKNNVYRIRVESMDNYNAQTEFESCLEFLELIKTNRVQVDEDDFQDVIETMFSRLDIEHVGYFNEMINTNA